MRIHVYDKPHEVRAGFEDYLDPAKTAVVSIDMHRGRAMSSHQLTLFTISSARLVSPSSMSGRYCGAAVWMISTASARHGGVLSRSTWDLFQIAKRTRSKDRPGPNS